MMSGGGVAGGSHLVCWEQDYGQPDAIVAQGAYVGQDGYIFLTRSRIIDLWEAMYGLVR